MKLFKVEKNTNVYVVKNDVAWLHLNVKDFVTTKENIFEIEDMVIDPIGKIGFNREAKHIGGYYARQGYYGFKKDGWVMLVHISNVKVL